MTKLKFATTYSFDYSLTPNSIIECQNGDYIIVGKAHNKDSHSSAFAIRVNYKGNVIWKKIYSSPLPQFFTSIIQTTNGDLVATGIYYYSEYASDEYTWIVKLDENGNIVWQKTLGFVGMQSEGYDICATSDGGFAITSLFYNGISYKTRIFKFNNEYELQWDELFDIGVAFSIVETMDNGFMLSGAINTLNSSLNNIFILRIDSNGKKLWDRIYSEFIDSDIVNSSIIEMKNGHFAVVAKSIIFEINSIGNIVWSKKNSNYKLNNIIQSKEGNYIISGSSTINNNSHAFIECIGSNNQESLWSTTELLYPSETTDLILSKDDYLVTCAYAPINIDKSLVCFALFSY